MCGLVGVASKHPVQDRGWLLAGKQSLLHRGPDDDGELWSDDGRVGLAHRRLAIVELSKMGHQPMIASTGGVSVVFNGEIYNYQELRSDLIKKGYSFRSKSDTEVLLNAYLEWGAEFLTRLNGMFAIALHDKNNQGLLLARDRAGEKPLFYRREPGGIRFSSELKALLVDPTISRHLNSNALDCYLAMGFVPANECMLEGFNKLPPAHALSFSLTDGTLHTWCYCELPCPPTIHEKHEVKEEVLLDEFEKVLEDAIGRQLIADVPVGVMLSGGVDSSLITALACRNQSNVHTFCMTFPGQEKHNESSHAQLIASHFGTYHIELTSDPLTADILPILARQFDEPMVDSSMIPTYFLSQKIREYCTVVLGGDGGDELFAGYNHYSRLVWMQKRLSLLPVSIGKGVAGLAESVFPVGFKGRNYLQALGCDFGIEIPLLARYFDSKDRISLMQSEADFGAYAEKYYDSVTSDESDLIQRATRTDFGSYLSEDILVKVDRASMAHSLEVRAPFLDHRVIEFAYGCVPSELKATSKSRKIFLKRLAARLLPSHFDMQRKQGFSIPLKDWLKAGPFRELFWDTLSSTTCTFDRKMTKNLLKNQDRGYDNSERLFALVQFELWRKNYNVTI